MICFPNAKINIGLRVLSKRKDGFHNISSYFLPIPICDVLEVQIGSSTSKKILGNYIFFPLYGPAVILQNIRRGL